MKSQINTDDSIAVIARPKAVAIREASRVRLGGRGDLKKTRLRSLSRVMSLRARKAWQSLTS